MDNKDNGGFSFTYSAKEQTEIKRIREKYSDNGKKEESKMERLLRLDAGVTKKAQTVSLILGIVGVLILGFGMSIIMTDLGSMLGIADGLVMLIGIAIGIVGCIPVALAYPIYELTLKRERKRIAPEILSLTDELMK